MTGRRGREHPQRPPRPPRPHRPHRNDAFGNVIDPVVGYARGAILSSSHEETLRNERAQALIGARVEKLGPESIYVFTGMAGELSLAAEDLATLARESIGRVLFGRALREQALAHLGGAANDGVAVLNRTSGGIIAAALAFCAPGETLISLVPGAISHPSLTRGAELAGASLLEVSDLRGLQRGLEETEGRLVIVTGVTSEQVVMPEADLVESLRLIRRAGRISLVDDAYGARVRTVLFGQPAARSAGADLAITSNQKAGLTGPTAGLLVGDPSLVRRVLSVAAQHGLEARAAIALGVLRSLERYTPARLLADAAVGKELHAAMSAAFGPDRVSLTALGPIIEEDDILAIALARTRTPETSVSIVPSEASAGLGMLLLEHHGILTVNAAGTPGSRVSLRLKASSDEMERVGHPRAVVAAVQDAFDRLARVVADADAMRRLILPAG